MKLRRRKKISLPPTPEPEPSPSEEKPEIFFYNPHQQLKLWTWKRIIFLLFAGLVFAGIALGVNFLLQSVDNLPEMARLEKYRPELATNIYASDGDTLVGEFFQNKRDLASLAEYPPLLLQAIVASEDERFFNHPGIDPEGILRAIWVDVKAMKKKEGASTFTQQLAKRLYLSPAKTWKRKANEVILALQIEKKYSKDEILEMYMNQVFLGHGANGFKSAAEFYFNKPPRDLNLAECATLVGMLRAPTRYSPYKNPKRSKLRRGVVLNRMLDVGYISKEEAQIAKVEELKLNPKRRKVPQKNLYPYFNDQVRRTLLSHLVVDYPEEHILSETELNEGGYSVKTTLNPGLQQAAVKAFRNGIRRIEEERHHHYYHWGEPVRPVEPTRIVRGGIYESKIESVTGSTVIVSLRTLEKRPKSMNSNFVSVEIDPDDSWLGEFDLLKPGYFIQVKCLEPGNSKTPPTFVYHEYSHAQGALVALDPKTGKILSLVGGYKFFDQKNKGQFNRAILAKKQPGSVFKPVLYSAALSKGFTPISILKDEPRTFVYGKKTWEPKNYHDLFYYDVTLQDGAQ